MTDLFNLIGKVALVTGASRGIGESGARLLAAHGAHVIVSSRRAESCEQVAQSITQAGGSAEVLPCHIGDLDQIDQCMAQIEQQHGRLDILVNNAATNPYFGHVLDTDIGAFQKTVDVNIRGYFFASVAGGKLMRKNDGGSIINTASVNALQPGPGQAIYSITKAAVVNMTKAFARECASDKIRCNALLPGLTKTRFASALFDDEKTHRMLMQKIPMGRHAEPDEMAGTILYLASDASSYTTGECIVVDGGLTL